MCENEHEPRASSRLWLDLMAIPFGKFVPTRLLARAPNVRWLKSARGALWAIYSHTCAIRAGPLGALGSLGAFGSSSAFGSSGALGSSGAFWDFAFWAVRAPMRVVAAPHWFGKIFPPTILRVVSSTSSSKPRTVSRTVWWCRDVPRRWLKLMAAPYLAASVVSGLRAVYHPSTTAIRILGS